jgi:hypothetical protein
MHVDREKKKVAATFLVSLTCPVQFVFSRPFRRTSRLTKFQDCTRIEGLFCAGGGQNDVTHLKVPPRFIIPLGRIGWRRSMINEQFQNRSGMRTSKRP